MTIREVNEQGSTIDDSAKNNQGSDQSILLLRVGVLQKGNAVLARLSCGGSFLYNIYEKKRKSLELRMIWILMRLWQG
jgi:hypothetical protein